MEPWWERRLGYMAVAYPSRNIAHQEVSKVNDCVERLLSVLMHCICDYWSHLGIENLQQHRSNRVLSRVWTVNESSIDINIWIRYLWHKYITAIDVDRWVITQHSLCIASNSVVVHGNCVTEQNETVEHVVWQNCMLVMVSWWIWVCLV